MPLRVLLIDDSRLIRTAVADIIARIDGVEVCGEASNGLAGISKMILEQPTLAILDVEMPVMNGIETLEEMRRRKIDTPVIMLSGLTREGAAITLQALDLGAIDFITKPTVREGANLEEVQDDITRKIESFQRSLKTSHAGVPDSLTEEVEKTPTPEPEAFEPELIPAKKNRNYRFLVLGSSTGGPRALQKILQNLPEDFPLPIIIIQYMPALFTQAFAERLNTLTPLEVCEAVDKDILKPGHVYIAPGDRHLQTEVFERDIQIRLNTEPRVNGHRPSIDVTLESAHSLVGGDVAAVIMTGMGKDGARGMKKINTSGGLTIAQDELSSVIFGMNRQAIELDAIDHTVPLDRIAPLLLKYLK